MKPSICKIMVGAALLLSPARAMYEEEALKFPQAKLAQHSINIAPQMSYKEDAPFETLSDELFVSVFRFLDINDIGRMAQVSTHWKRVTEDPALWRYMGSRYYGDYLSKEDLEENQKQKVISHYLSVIVNTKTDLKEIERLVSHYRLDLYILLLKKYLNLSCLSDLKHLDSINGDLIIVQDNKNVIKSCCKGYENNTTSELNELLVTQGNTEAIKRKLDGLLEGKYGYDKDLVAAKELNELLIGKGDLYTMMWAINRKLKGLLQGGKIDRWLSYHCNEGNAYYGGYYSGYGYYSTSPTYIYYPGYGYENDPVAARAFIQDLVISDILIVRAIGKYIKAFAMKHGVVELGYTKDPEKAVEFIKQNHVPY